MARLAARALAAIALAVVLADRPAASAQAAAAPIARCDTLAAHPADPDRTAPGLAREAMDLAAAEEACLAALAAAPVHARTRYQLGRTLFYQGRAAEALPHLEQAARSGYRQGLFVLGLLLEAGNGIASNPCRARDLWRQAAALDHPWSAFYLLEKEADQRFAACGPGFPETGRDRLIEIVRTQITLDASRGRVEALLQRIGQAAAPTAR